MDFKQTLSTLRGAKTNDAIAGRVLSITTALEAQQGHLKTREFNHYMLHSQNTIEERITAIMRHLDMGYKPQMGARNNEGHACGFFSVNTSSRQVAHVVFGIANVFGIYVTVINDLVTKQRYLHAAIGAHLEGTYNSKANQFSFYRVSNPAEFPDLLDKLIKLQKFEDLEEPEAKMGMMEYLRKKQEDYEKHWGPDVPNKTNTPVCTCGASGTTSTPKPTPVPTPAPKPTPAPTPPKQGTTPSDFHSMDIDLGDLD